MALSGVGGVVEGVMNQAWGRAISMSDLAETHIDEALALAGNAPRINSPSSVDAPVLPEAPTLAALNQATATALYDSTRDDVVNMLTGMFTGFLAEYFPRDDFIDDAAEWVHRALTSGGSGINATVEAQLWNRAREKALVDAQRARESMEAEWAARRFPMPTGALRHGALQIDLAAQNAIAEAGRTAAIESFKAEVENARIAVERAVSLRSMALSSAGEYIRTLAQGPQVAASVSNTIIDAQSRFASTVTDFYRAQVTAAEIPVRVGTVNAELKARTNEANLRTAMETLTQRVSAVVANAQMVGTQAAAALNAIHTQASISGSDSTQTNIEG